MYFTRDKVIYNKGEHFTFFDKDVKEIYGYSLLHTTSDRSRYAINTVPVYLKRSEKIEQGFEKRRLVDEYLLEEHIEKERLYHLVHYFYLKKLKRLYEKVRLFSSEEHFLTEELEEGELPFWCVSSHLGYSILKKKIFPYYDAWSSEWKFQRVIYEVNDAPVLCEKAVGDLSYDHPGVLLSSSDMNVLRYVKEKENVL